MLARGSAVRLAEAVEDKRKESGTDALTGIAYPELQVTPGALDSAFDATAGRR